MTSTLDWSQCPAVESVPGRRKLWRNSPSRANKSTLYCISRHRAWERPSHPRCEPRPSMLILFDHGTPRSIARWLKGHTVIEAIERGWDRLNNGALLKAAEEDRRIAIVILGNSQRPAVHRYIDRVVAAVNSATTGSFTEVDIPYE